MSNSNKAILYTQPNCNWCIILEEKVKEAEIDYEKIDITENISAKKFLKAEGHTTVPQLYYKHHHLNTMETKKISADFLQNSIALYKDMDTINDLMDSIEEETTDKDWPNQDSGVENFA